MLIEHVKPFKAQLHPARFGKCEVFEEREIKILIGITPQNVTARVAPAVIRGTGGATKQPVLNHC